MGLKDEDLRPLWDLLGSEMHLTVAQGKIFTGKSRAILLRA
jgi:hypothetical protein